MQFRIDADTLINAFSDSVTKLTDSIVEMAERVDREDPDPEVTKAHHMDRMIRSWFNNGGNLGY